MKTKYLTFVAVAFMMASCSHDEDFVPQDNLKDTPIAVTAGVGQLKTRAGYDSNNLPEKFYLTVTQESGVENSQYNYTEVEMTKGDSNGYTPTTPMLWKDGEHSTTQVWAYTIPATDNNYQIASDQTTADKLKGCDILGAFTGYVNSENANDKDITITDNVLGIRFRHLLCKLDIDFSWGSEFKEITNKSIVSVKYTNVNNQVQLDRTDCTVSSVANIVSIDSYFNDMKSEALIGVGNYTPTIEITTNINGETRTFMVNVNAPTEGFVSGNRYTMTVSIGGTAVSSITESPEGWGDSISGGDLTNN